MTDALARGWLVAWIVWSAVPVGSLVLVMIHAVTGGRWDESLAPVLRPMTALVPFAALAFLGVAAGLEADFVWAAGPSAAKPDVARYYLSPSLFLLRAGIALAGWSMLAVLSLTGRMSKLAAGLGLSFYGLMINLVAVDWILSVEPGFNSSAFAAAIALHQILAALAFAALVSPPSLDARAASDLSNLMLASLLGVLYMALMAFVVAWYGDLPTKAAWYLKRGEGIWGGVLIAALIGGGMLPFAMLLFSTVRRSPAVLRAVGLLLLAGVALHLAWTILPAYGEQAATAAGFAALDLIVLVLLSRVVLRLLGSRVRRLGHA